jgi:hypothetical protein
MKIFETKKTNSEVDVVVFNLINHAYDESELVKASILYSLLDISQHQPELVLTSIASYVSKRLEKIEMGHRVQLLQIMVKISEAAREHIKLEIATQIVEFASQEMISVQEVKTDLQSAASQTLVNLSLCFPEAVITSLLSLCKPGVEPHYFIVRTLSDTAAANPISTVINLRDILSRIIPVLGLVKNSPMKWIFASALGRFAEGINFFLGNATEDQRTQVDLSSFESDMASAWDVLFSKWLEGEPKVKFVVLESLGYLASVLGTRDFDSRFQKLAPTYLQHYKTEQPKDQLPITLGMSALISKAVTDDRSFNNHVLLTQIMTGLHELITASPQQDPISNPTGLRNTSEVLRCWEILCRYLPDLTLTFIVNKFQLKSCPTRVASLVIIRHLVNSLDSILLERRNIIMSSVTTLLSQPELSLRSTILQLIASMANQGYFVLEGAEQLIRFTCKEAANKIPQKKEGEPGTTTTTTTTTDGKEKQKLEDLKRSAERLLITLSTKVPTALPVMWPFLLELVCDKDFTPGIAIIFKAIGEICKAKAENNDSSYILQLEQFVNIPPPQSLVARIFILLSQPTKQVNLGINVSNAAIYLGQSIHPPLGQYWAETMPALIQHLENNQNEPTFSLSKWQDTVLKVFREGLVTVGNEQWLTDLVQFITQQIKNGDGVKDPDATRLLFRFLGATLSRIQNKQLIQTHIDFMLNTVNHKNESERRGVAQGLGMIGNPHLDMILPRITELLTTTPEHRKAVGGFLGFGAKDLGPEDEVKATAVLAYGYITAYANPQTILSRLDVHILHNMIPLLGLPTLDGKPVKEVTYPAPVLKIQLAKSLELIAKTVHPSRIPASQTGFVLKKRDELVQGVLQMLDEKGPSGKPTNELRLLCLTTLSTLSLLEPKYSSQMCVSIYNAVIPSYQLLLDNSEIKSTSSVLDDYSAKKPTEKDPKDAKDGKDAKDAKEAKVSSSLDDGEINPLESPGETLMNHVNTVWQSLVQLNPTVDCILSIITKLQPLLQNKNAIVRQRAITSYLLILKKFVPKISQEKIAQKEQCFPELGKRASFIMARVSDSIDSIRSMAVECIQAMLYIDQLLSNPAEIKPRQDVKSLSELKQKIGVHSTPPLGAVQWTDVDVVRSHRYVLLDQCTATFASASTAGDVVELIRAMISKLNDYDIQSGLGLSRILSKAVSIRGQSLFSELGACLEAYIEAFKKPIKKEIKCAALQSLRLITKMHFTEVLDLLLKTASSPLTREFAECFITLVDPVDLLLTSAGDWVEDQYALSFDGMETNKQLSSRVLEHLCSIVNETPMDTKAPAPLVMAATCALEAIFQAANGVPSIAPLGKPKPTAAENDAPKKAASPAGAKKPAAKDAPVEKEVIDPDTILNYVFNYNSTQDAASQSALQQLLISKYATLLPTLLMRIGTSYKVHQATPENASPEQLSMKQIIKALKQFLPAVSQNGVLASLDDVANCCYNPNAHKRDLLNNQVIKEVNGEIWSKSSLIDNKHYDDSVAVIVRMVICDKPLLMKPIIKFLSHFLSQQAHVGQRVIATAIIAEFITHTSLDELAPIRTPLQDEMIRLLLPKVADKEDKVRKHALRGLGNLVLVWGSPNIIANATAIITSCSGATEDTSSEVAAEAVSSLTRISSVSDTSIISPMLVSICFRIRGAFDRNQARVRKAAFELFAEMCRFGVRAEVAAAAPPGKYDEDVNNNFLEQVHTNVPIYLVHLWDIDANVRKAAMEGLKYLALLLHPELESFCDENLGKIGQTNVTFYDEDDSNSFLHKISLLLCTHHNDRLRGYMDSCLGYYSSSWNQIRGNAAYLTGVFIRHSEVQPGTRKKLNLHSITSALVKLLDQHDAAVRNQTSKALAFLYDV